jgi:hypothetical protein
MTTTSAREQEIVREAAMSFGDMILSQSLDRRIFNEF